MTAPSTARLLRHVLWLAALVLPWAAGAQVIRCTDPASGRVTYTDGECNQGQSRKEVAPKQSPEEIERQYEQAHEALRLQRERQQAQAAQEAAAPPAAPTQPVTRPPVVDPAQSAQCIQAQAALRGALALDPTRYDTNTRIHAAQESADVACLTPAEYARLRERTRRDAPVYGAPGYTTPIVVVPQRPPHRPHKSEPRPEMVQCNVFRCYDKNGKAYPR